MLSLSKDALRFVRNPTHYTPHCAPAHICYRRRMQLFHSPNSPFARKVRVSAAELGLDGRIELVETHVAPTRPNRDYAEQANPLRKVPALVADDGAVLHDSGVICLYLDALAGGGRLVPADGPERWRVLTGHALASGMTEAAVLLRYETAVRPEEYRWQAWADDQWDRIRAGLAWYEARPDALAPPLELAQIALGCLLGYLDFRFADRGWRDSCPGLAAWFAELGQRPSFATTRPG